MFRKSWAVPLCGLAALIGAAAAESPQLEYQSAYAQYKPYREEPLASWRAVNENVARVGGHIGIFAGGRHQGHGGGQPADAPAGKESAAPSSPAPAHGSRH